MASSAFRRLALGEPARMLGESQAGTLHKLRRGDRRACPWGLGCMGDGHTTKRDAFRCPDGYARIRGCAENIELPNLTSGHRRLIGWISLRSPVVGYQQINGEDQCAVPRLALYAAPASEEAHPKAARASGAGRCARFRKAPFTHRPASCVAAYWRAEMNVLSYLIIALLLACIIMLGWVLMI